MLILFSLCKYISITFCLMCFLSKQHNTNICCIKCLRNIQRIIAVNVFIYLLIYSHVVTFPFQAIDVWMGVCTAFVFAALVEFTFVNYMWRSQSIKEGKRKQYDQGRPSMMKGKQHRESRARTNSFFPCLERQESLVELDMVIILRIRTIG